jgi:hypothetical protein
MTLDLDVLKMKSAKNSLASRPCNASSISTRPPRNCEMKTQGGSLTRESAKEEMIPSNDSLFLGNGLFCTRDIGRIIECTRAKDILESSSENEFDSTAGQDVSWNRIFKFIISIMCFELTKSE